MTPLQNDLLEIYNSLHEFSEATINAARPIPIKVSFNKKHKALIFEQKGKVVYLLPPTFYCLGLEDLEKGTYLLPEDYDYLMSSLMGAIQSGKLLEPRTCLGPENYGFGIYATEDRELEKGPDIIADIKFISGTSWLFKFLTKRKYGI